ncbi:MAG TPA: BMP family ABC transporter substrate-binding protein [Candidatus Limnocylindria bacterium]|nr:BMP family ABC transporter substrate-binding protein [Candidatus Limnocylindria bacterium]
MRKHSSVAILAILATLALVISACTSPSPGASGSAATANGLCRPIGDATAEETEAPETAPPGSSDLKIGLVTDVGTLDDRNFNQYSWEGALRGAAIVGAAEPQSIVTTESSEYENNIQSFVDEDYDIIVTVGFALGEATLAAAEENPDIHFIGVDQFQAGDDPVAGAGLDNYESLIFNEAQAGYLAGIVAASISESGEIAAIGGSGTIPPVVNYMRGYENGAKSVNPDATVHLKYISDDLAVAFNDPTAGKTFADQFIQQNADVDVLFQVAGKTGNGVLQSVTDAGIYGIGVDVDQWLSNPDSAECTVTSAEKKLTLAVSEGIAAVGDDSPRAGNVFYGADNDGIGLAPFYQFADLIDAETQSAIDEALASMASGDLDPCQPSGLCYAGEADPGT